MTRLIVLFLIGSFGYGSLELLWRGFTHWTMALTGGLAYLLQIGGKPVGKHLWSLDSVSETWDNLYSMGELSQATVKISLTEYVETM